VYRLAANDNEAGNKYKEICRKEVVTHLMYLTRNVQM
jgi:hypothetical protein